jgi:hypothetical protein
MSIVWILVATVLTEALAATSLQLLRQHPDLLAGAADTRTDPLAVLAWTQFFTPQGLGRCLAPSAASWIQPKATWQSRTVVPRPRTRR